jgi:hypothetical protein
VPPFRNISVPSPVFEPLFFLPSDVSYWKRPALENYPVALHQCWGYKPPFCVAHRSGAATLGMPGRRNTKMYLTYPTREEDRNAQDEDQVEREKALSADGHW